MNTASSKSGIAPFAVFFDAVDGSSGVLQPGSINGRKEYADLFYYWDFGDPGKGNWPESNKSKNHDVGYVTSHVYDNPGNYTVTLTIKNSAGQTFTYTQDITVQDPDIVFSGQNTICLSSSGNFTDAPANSLQVTTTDITQILNYAATGKRILLCRGDSWTTSGYISLMNIPGPVAIGAYGMGTNPDERGIFDNAPIVNVTGTHTSGFFGFRNINDFTISDLHLIGDTTYSSALGGATDIDNVLQYRMHIEGFQTTVGYSHWDTDGHDRIMIASSHIHDAKGNIIYIGSERLVLMGNLVYNSSATHIIRVWQGHKAVINHNILHGSSLHNTSGRHALKLHCPTEALISSTGSDHLEKRTKYVLLYDNIFGTCGPWPVHIAPQTVTYDERIEDVLVTGNRFLSGYGSFSSLSLKVNISLRIIANYVTVRNNIFDGTGSDSYYHAVVVHPSNFISSVGNRIFNNTVYKNDFIGTYTTYQFARIYNGSDNTTVQNNLMLHGSSTPTVLAFIIDEATNTTVDHNLLTDQINCVVDADNINLLDRDFHLVNQTAPVDSGTQVSIFHDYDLIDRPVGSAIDIGAFEYNANLSDNPINTKKETDLLKIFPNPSNGKFNIELSEIESEKVNVEILSIDGRIVFNGKYRNKDVMKINVSSLPVGIYLLKATTNTRIIAKQIVIN
ncbi:MAG: T9SS type A sorting domain-containing protein [bacterium]|nr:T9SS type A sorting domain-containing protein [bacterium]